MRNLLILLLLCGLTSCGLLKKVHKEKHQEQTRHAQTADSTVKQSRDSASGHRLDSSVHKVVRDSAGTAVQIEFLDTAGAEVDVQPSDQGPVVHAKGKIKAVHIVQSTKREAIDSSRKNMADTVHRSDQTQVEVRARMEEERKASEASKVVKGGVPWPAFLTVSLAIFLIIFWEYIPGWWRWLLAWIRKKRKDANTSTK